MFYRLKDFVEENSVETSDTGTISISKIIWLICNPGFSKYFPETMSDEYKWITDPYHLDMA
jgi:hypothetical protein